MHWKTYENQIFARLLSEFPKYQIQADQKVLGRYSEVDRQIDILLSGSMLNYELRGVVDCKCFSKKIDVKTVDQFVGLMADANAHVGILVTNEGFTPAAKQRAANDPQTIQLELINFDQLAEWRFDSLAVAVPTTLAALSQISDPADPSWTELERAFGEYFNRTTPALAESIRELVATDRRIMEILARPPYQKEIETIALEASFTIPQTSIRLKRLIQAGYILQNRTEYSISHPAFVIWYLLHQRRNGNIMSLLTEYLTELAVARNYRDAAYVSQKLELISVKDE